MKEIIINKNDAGQRLDRFLSKAFSGLSQGVIRKGIRTKNIKVENKRTDAAYKLKENDAVQLYFNDNLLSKDSDKILPSNPIDISDKIIYEDENIILADKPVGLVVHEDNENSQETLINALLYYLIKKGEYSPDDEMSFCPALCNRIDRNTGGIVIAAKNAETLRVMSEKLRNRELKKLYLCVVYGKIEKNCDFTVLNAFLEKKSEKNEVIISHKKSASNLAISTAYRAIDNNDYSSLLEVDLLTGRTHQIRAHLASEGYPLLGDGKYGVNKINKQYGYKTQALYSYKLSFNFKANAGVLNYLNNKSFEIDKNNIWFIKKFYEKK